MYRITEQTAVSSDDTGLREILSELWAWSLNLQERQQEILNIQAELKHQSLPLPEQAKLSYQKAILLDIEERYSEAIESYEKALEINPDTQASWYNKACCYALQGKIELAIQNLEKAIQLNPEEYREMAETDSDFDKIRADVRFQKLLEANSETRL